MTEPYDELRSVVIQLNLTELKDPVKERLRRFGFATPRLKNPKSDKAYSSIGIDPAK